MVTARILAIDYFLPDGQLTNEGLSREFPEWTVEKIASKTGIHTRHIVAADEFSSDLAVKAAERLFTDHEIDRESIDFVILCTQSPDFYMPSTAGAVQHRLGLRHGIGATDINLGCSGFVYALGLAKGLVESRLASNVLVITVDTYSRYINPGDKSVRTLFGDGASATLVSGVDDEIQDDAIQRERLYAFTYGTDGRGADSLIVPNGGLRPGQDVAPKTAPELRGLTSNGFDLYMDGPAIFNFTLDVVPTSVEEILRKAELGMGDIDLFVFHQANAYMLEHLRKKLGIDANRFFVSMAHSGNTVSSTIPIALAEAERQGALRPGMQVMLLGFGVGLSWGGLIVRW
jgi:3-oxoacyl-[acyl-carrier-protein] synthase III